MLAFNLATGDVDGVDVGGIFHPAGTTLTISEAKRAKVDAFGIAYEGRGGFSSADFAWSG